MLQPTYWQYVCYFRGYHTFVRIGVDNSSTPNEAMMGCSYCSMCGVQGVIDDEATTRS